jgi:tRNA 2-thiouridine synthesizing protein A
MSDSDDSMAPVMLDARRLLCPLPVIRTQDRIAALTPGDRLTVYCTDPGVIHDIPAWCRIHGHIVIECRETDDEIIIVIEVGVAALNGNSTTTVQSDKG